MVAAVLLGGGGRGPSVLARALASCVRLSELGLHSLVLSREENDLGVGRLSHCLHSLEVPDLHGRCRGQNVGSLTHELGALDFGAGGDDLGLSRALALRSHGERVLQFLAEDDVLDQHGLDLNAPAGCGLFDDFANGLGDFLAALNDVLEDAGADDMAEGCLRALDKRLADVGDAEGGFVRRGDAVVDDGCEL